MKLNSYTPEAVVDFVVLVSRYIATDIHRNAIANFKPNVNDVNDINAWGLGLPPGKKKIARCKKDTDKRHSHVS